MKERWITFIDVLHYLGIMQVLISIVRYLLDLMVALSTATLFMRFVMMCGQTQIFAITVGVVIGALTIMYLKFRSKLQ